MALLEATEITKRYGGIVALDHVSLEVRAGEAVGLVGPNGAGKTTLFDCVNGLQHPDGGTVVFDGTRVDAMAIYRRARLGIGRTFQRVELFSGMTVREHLLVAERVHRGDGRLWKDLVGRSHAGDRVGSVEELIDELGLAPFADAPIESLSLGQGRLVELGRTLVQGPRLVLLDEPSSGLDSSETADVAEVLIRLRSSGRTAMLLVEHDLDLVRSVVGRIYVLDFGKLLASGETEAVLASDAVRRAYVGDVT